MSHTISAVVFHFFFLLLAMTVVVSAGSCSFYNGDSCDDGIAIDQNLPAIFNSAPPGKVVKCNVNVGACAQVAKSRRACTACTQHSAGTCFPVLQNLPCYVED